jgi:hypothetical protein
VLYRFWSGWRRCLEIVRPDTVLRWHRRAFAWHWTRKSRHLPGRPEVAANIRDLIRRMSQANPLWGAPRIHGELLKLGSFMPLRMTNLQISPSVPNPFGLEFVIIFKCSSLAESNAAVVQDVEPVGAQVLVQNGRNRMFPRLLEHISFRRAVAGDGGRKRRQSSEARGGQQRAVSAVRQRQQGVLVCAVTRKELGIAGNTRHPARRLSIRASRKPGRMASKVRLRVLPPAQRSHSRQRQHLRGGGPQSWLITTIFSR